MEGHHSIRDASKVYLTELQESVEMIVNDVPRNKLRGTNPKRNSAAN